MPENVFGHPKGLLVCFLTELWERFAYYGMLSLLILYLTKSYLLSDAEGNRIVAAYGALIWMLPVIGGLLSDRLLGSRKAVIVGSLLMSVGFISISFPALLTLVFPAEESLDGLPPIDIFYLSLAIIITGIGFLKANIATIVGAIYEPGDPRRDSGFTIFYWGINLGAAIGPLVCGGIGHAFGMRYGFSAAGVGMLIALVTFLYGQKYLGTRTDSPQPQTLRKRLIPGLSVENSIYLAGILIIIVVWQLLNFHQVISALMSWFGVATGLFIIYFSIRHCPPIERDRMLVVTLLLIFNIVYTSLYMQMFGSLLLFSDRFVDRSFFSFELAASQLQSIPAMTVILLAPVIGYLWVWLARRRKNPSIPVKFSIGLALTGLAFLIPSVSAWVNGSQANIGLLWFSAVFIVMTIGEICFFPIAMSMVSRLCATRILAMMMGVLYFTQSIGSIIAGELAARLTTVDEAATSGQEPATAAIDVYISAYALFGLIALAASVVLYLLSPLLYQRMHDVADTDGQSHIQRLYRRLGIMSAPAG